MSNIMVVDQRLNEIKTDILLHLKRQWEDVLIVGKLAAEAKTLLQHGQYENWIRESLGVSPQLIRGYRRIYERFDTKPKDFFDLPFSAGLLLASSSVPDGALAEIGMRLEAGERFTVEGVDAVIDRYRTIQGSHTGTEIILSQHGTTDDGQPAKQIPASYVRSLNVVTAQALNEGTVTIDGKDYLATQPLPSAVTVGVQHETNRRAVEHIQDNIVEIFGTVSRHYHQDDGNYALIRLVGEDELKTGQQVIIKVKP